MGLSFQRGGYHTRANQWVICTDLSHNIAPAALCVTSLGGPQGYPESTLRYQPIRMPLLSPSQRVEKHFSCPGVSPSLSPMNCPLQTVSVEVSRMANGLANVPSRYRVWKLKDSSLKVCIPISWWSPQIVFIQHPNRYPLFWAVATTNGTSQLNGLKPMFPGQERPSWEECFSSK